MVIALMLVLAQTSSGSCLRLDNNCIRAGARSFVAGIIDVGDSRYVLLSNSSIRNVSAVVEYRVTNATLEEVRCTDSPHDPLEALRTTRGENRAYQSLCDGRMMDSGKISQVDEEFASNLELEFSKIPRHPERAKCSLVGRTFQKTAEGFVVGAIEICDEGTKPAQYIVSFDREGKLVRAVCDPRLPADGTHVTKLRAAPFKVLKGELHFSDPCADTPQWAETVTYRLDADGNLSRSSTARRAKPLR